MKIDNQWLRNDPVKATRNICLYSLLPRNFLILFLIAIFLPHKVQAVETHSSPPPPSKKAAVQSSRGPSRSPNGTTEEQQDPAIESIGPMTYKGEVWSAEVRFDNDSGTSTLTVKHGKKDLDSGEEIVAYQYRSNDEIRFISNSGRFFVVQSKKFPRPLLLTQWREGMHGAVMLIFDQGTNGTGRIVYKLPFLGEKIEDIQFCENKGIRFEYVDPKDESRGYDDDFVKTTSKNWPKNGCPK